MTPRLPTLALAAVLAAPAAAQDLSLGPRLLPPPSGASPEFREMLAGLPTPTVAEAMAAPRSVEALLAGRPAEEELTAALAQGIADAMGVTIEETTLGGTTAWWVRPAAVSPRFEGDLFVYVHGGAWIKGAGMGSTLEAIGIAATLGIEAVSIDYRLAPEATGTALRDDVLAAYAALVETHDPARIAMGGTSAGANLTLTSVQAMPERGLPRPAALMINTPAIWMDKQGDARVLMEGADRALVTWDGEPAWAVEVYLDGMDPRDPAVAPAYGSVEGFPPTYLLSGTRDLMLSDTVVMHRMLRAADVEADLHVYEGLSHGDHAGAVGTPEAAEHLRELGDFVDAHLGG